MSPLDRLRSPAGRAELTDEQSRLIFGGTLSTRFASLPLTWSHPMMVGAFYGGLVSLVLILPSTQGAPDLAAWLLAWSLQSLGVVAFTATCGLASHIITNARPRAPMKPMRRALYPMPFVGALLLSLDATLDAWPLPREFGWVFILFPGIAWIHISWAPRWHLLTRVASGAPLPGPVHGEEEGPHEVRMDADLDAVIESLDD